MPNAHIYHQEELGLLWYLLLQPKHVPIFPSILWRRLWGINSDERRQKKSNRKTDSAKLVLEEKGNKQVLGVYVGRGWNDGTSGYIEDDWGDNNDTICWIFKSKNYLIQGYSIVSVCIIVEVFLLQGHSLPLLPLPFGIVVCANWPIFCIFKWWI